MTSGWLAAIIAGAVSGCGVVYTAGQLVAILKQLRDIAKDHEDRIRILEGRPPAPLRPDQARR